MLLWPKGGEVSHAITCVSGATEIRHLLTYLRLCVLQLEKRFADPRDIEFAVDAANNIYLLQVSDGRDQF